MSYSGRFTYRSFSHSSRTAATRLPHLESWSRISRPPPRTRPKIPFPHARTRSAKNFFEIVSSRPHSRPDKIIRAIKAEAQKKKESVADREKKRVKIVTFHVYGANVTIVGAAAHHPAGPLAASSFTRSPPPSLARSLQSRRSHTHSRRFASTQLDADIYLFMTHTDTTTTQPREAHAHV